MPTFTLYFIQNMLIISLYLLQQMIFCVCWNWSRLSPKPTTLAAHPAALEPQVLNFEE